MKLLTLFFLSCSSLFVISCAGSKTGNPSDFVAHYSFDNNLMDLSGHYNHANKYGKTIKFDTGYVNNGIRFNNKNIKNIEASNDFLKLPNINVINFTVAFWIKYEKNNNEFNSTIYSFGDNRNGLDPRSFFAFRVTNIGMLWVSMQSGINFVETPQLDISNGEWMHVAVTINRNKINLFQNGELYFTKKIEFTHEFYDLPQYVAYHQWEDGRKGSSRFSGTIDELYIYNRALKDDEIKKLFNNL